MKIGRKICDRKWFLFGKVINQLLLSLLFGSAETAWSGSFEIPLNILRTEYENAYSAGRFEQSLVSAKAILTALEKDSGTKTIDFAKALLDIASAYNGLAMADKALPLQQQALDIYKILLGAEHPDTAQAINKLALTYRNQGKPKIALNLQIQALAIVENSLSPRDIIVGRVANSLSVTYRDLGQYLDALVLQQRALYIYESNLEPDHIEVASAVSNLAQVYRAMARYEEALPLQVRALSITEKRLGPEHSETARMVNNLASTFQAIGQYEKAIQLYKRAVEIDEKTLGPEHRYTAAALHNLATVYKTLNRFDEALPLFQRALLINEKHLGPDHRYVGTVLNELGEIYSTLSQYVKALQFHQRALLISNRVFGPVHTDTAGSLTGIAIANHGLKQYETAIHFFQHALAINEEVSGPNHPTTLRNLKMLALTYKEIGHIDLAISILKLTVNRYQLRREQISFIGNEELESYTNIVSPVYQLLASFLIQKGNLSEAQIILDMVKENEQFDFVRRSENADHRRTSIGYNATEKVWMERYRQVANRLASLGAEMQSLQKQAKLGLSAEQERNKKVLADDLLIAQKAFDAFLKEMRSDFAHSGPARVADMAEISASTVSELQPLIQGLGHDAVLLQYIVTDDNVSILLTTPGVQLARSSKISAAELNRQIFQYRRLLRDAKSDVLPASKALYQLLIAPVVQDLEQAGAKTVMLSLDGALRYLPFSALHDGNRFLVERWNLPMYTSITKNRLKDAVSPQWKVAGFGVSRSIGEFPALPAVKAEMSSIVTKSGGGVLNGEIHLDEAFTALRLKDVSKRPFQLLHVASHFRFSPGTEVNSFLLLGDGQRLTLGDIRAQNYRFDKVDLLTLSACDTGLGGGRDAQGREIEGFGVIAQQQGAKAVLATLWPVADQSTATLMVEMYRSRQEQRLTKVEALRRAQISLMQQKRYAHPFYWAPFILMGNWL